MRIERIWKHRSGSPRVDEDAVIPAREVATALHIALRAEFVTLGVPDDEAGVRAHRVISTALPKHLPADGWGVRRIEP